MVLGVVVATVYGRFHYVLDTIAGLALGIMITSLYLGLESQKKAGIPTMLEAGKMS